MSTAAELIDTEEKARLEECVKERIHTPGAIQPHGALLAVCANSFEIRQISANCGQILGIDAVELLGRSLAVLAGPMFLDRVREVLDKNVPLAANPVSVLVQGIPFDAIVHRSESLVLVEFEKADPSSNALYTLPALYAAIQRLSGASTVEELWSQTALEMHALTQFDRVMVYHFHPDGHGEVVAEERADDMEPYLGLHYPASDIPVQARRLYILKPSRLIVSSDYAGAPLLKSPDFSSEAELDLSKAELRSVSPHHLQFMRNMGQASTFSLSLIHNGELIGMITCAHRTTLHLPYRLRQGYEILARQVALQLRAMTEIQGLTNQLRIRSVRDQLVDQLSTGKNITDALLHRETTLLDLVSADGVVVGLDNKFFSIGEVPAETQTSALIARLRSNENILPVSTSSMIEDHPDLATLAPTTAGVIVLPFGNNGDFIAWFRSEIIQTVDWLGDQSPSNRAAALSPRNSFSLWRQSVTGKADAWAQLEVSEATELCRDLTDVLLRRAESELVRLDQELHRTQVERRRSETLLQTVLNTVDVGVVVVDDEAREVLINARQRNNHQLALPEDGPQSVESELLIFGPDKITPVPPEERPLRRAASGRSFSDQLVWIGQGDQQRALSVSARPVKGDTTFDGSVVAFSDVTGFANAVTAKDDFVANVSHELRTPLTSIIGYLDLALEEEDHLPDGVLASLNVALGNAERLLLLVSDLLSTATAASAVIERRPADLAEIIHAGILTAAPRAEMNAVEIISEVPDALIAVIDPLRIGQVLDNLLSNAIKYSPDGGRVTIRAGSSPAGTTIHVTDTGIGMTEKEQAEVFTKFFRSGTARKAAIPGVGLGLVISKNIVEAHNGTITFKSKVGAGTAFTITLPANT